MFYIHSTSLNVDSFCVLFVRNVNGGTDISWNSPNIAGFIPYLH